MADPACVDQNADLCNYVYDVTGSEWLATASNWLIAKPFSILLLICDRRSWCAGSSVADHHQADAARRHRRDAVGDRSRQGAADVHGAERRGHGATSAARRDHGRPAQEHRHR